MRLDLLKVFLLLLLESACILLSDLLNDHPLLAILLVQTGDGLLLTPQLPFHLDQLILLGLLFSLPLNCCIPSLFFDAILLYYPDILLVLIGWRSHYLLCLLCLLLQN